MASLAIASGPVAASAESEYRALIADTSRHGGLDREPLATRTRQVFARLVGAVEPGSKPFAWEIHVTDDPAVNAFCMGPGKILVGARFVERLQLVDAEIAMLVAHEMAHAVAGHRRAAPRVQEGEGDPAAELQRNAIAIAQEEEADRIGFEIARRAGWTPEALIGFFEKLAADTPAGQFSTSHASAIERLEKIKKPGGGGNPPGQ